MASRTPLYDQHVAMGAKIVDFFGWEMPIHYGSQLNEHKTVRSDAGMFDVSHMNVLDLRGRQAKIFLQKLVANDVARLKDEGKALYTCMLNEQAGVIDDLIIYFIREGDYRIVLNAATREKDLAWITEQSAGFEVVLESPADLAMIAVQGPNARAKTEQVLGEGVGTKIAKMKPFNACFCDGLFIARTGYTGEEGYEIILSAGEAVALWQQLHQAGVAPIGLGARDTLRLEAAMSLYGAEMDETISPLECGLEWTVAWQPAERDFVGRSALQAQRDAGGRTKLVGLLLEERGVLRDHQKVISECGEGEITSGTFSPSLGQSIALARVPVAMGNRCQVEIRGKRLNARVVKPPFVRNGEACYKEPITQKEGLPR
ncbi:MAG: glycine cleavage system aminomethyltransferase GcvT [Gammaproteobacteria bacterium]|nr:glycine cleavage system aminomethyltransferase GcvT [Gammaproteobacteria bacterium]MCF6231289.1 glycine cleavage system aminomethyltransferase GcvT [Gammaproteobacteria bacterium]